MSATAILVGAMALATFVMVLGLAVFAGFLLIELIGLGLIFGTSGMGLFTNSIQSAATSPSLVAIPLFILMGEILFRSGAVAILFDSVDKLVGGFRGRLYFLTMAISTLFGALSGSAAAVAAMLGKSLIPDMLRRGYDKQIAATLVQTGASLAPIIPPSILVIIIGSIANVSIAKLLIAGILPGMLVAALACTWVAYRIRRDPSLIPPADGGTHVTATERAIAILKMMPFALVIFCVMGLMLLGVATPTEAAASGVVGALLCAASYRKFSISMLTKSLTSTVMISVTILVIIVSSAFFGQLLALSGATAQVIEYVTTLNLDPMTILLLIQVFSFLACMVLDATPYLLIAAPILDPIVTALGFDPVWFWLLFLMNLTVGNISPPFGFTMFALQASAPQHFTMREIFSSAWTAVLILCTGMGLVMIFPQIATWLPSLL